MMEKALELKVWERFQLGMSPTLCQFSCDWLTFFIEPGWSLLISLNKTTEAFSEHFQQFDCHMLFMLDIMTKWVQGFRSAYHNIHVTLITGDYGFHLKAQTFYLSGLPGKDASWEPP